MESYFVLYCFVTVADNDGEPVTVLDAVVVNTNRDHLSTAHLGEEDADARVLFGTLVALTRYEYIVEFLRAQTKSNTIMADLVEYRQALQDTENKLRSIR